VNHGHRFNPEHAAKLLSDRRREMLPPEQILAKLKIHSEHKVCDLGAGNGYFTIPIAGLTRGKVYAVDVEPKMLELLKNRANDAGIQNIEYKVADIAHTDLPDGSINRVFSSFVMHEVPDLDTVIEEVKRILDSQGQALILDWEKVESESGPPLHVRIPSEQLKEAFQAKGFKVLKEMIIPEVYALTLTK
jgi:ubiquinone/menaquinone biosynthesis C-methylase UbiE